MFAAPCGIVALLTDFGQRDHYAGAVKGAILSARPGVRTVDVTHEVEPYAIEQGAFFLEQVWRRFPEGTVFCAVVDPGVGGERGALAVACAGRYGIGPDNGLLHRALALGEPVVRALDVERFAVPPLSATFHGRDLFAPAAARLAAGEPFETFGSEIEDWVRLPAPAAGRVRVLNVDRYGNIVLDLLPEALGPRGAVLTAGGRVALWEHTYADAPEGEPFLLVGSSGYVEISIRQASAAERLHVRLAEELAVEPGW